MFRDFLQQLPLGLTCYYLLIKLIFSFRCCKLAFTLSASFVSGRHLQWTYSARETGVMKELENHNLTRITNAPAEFSSNFKEILYQLSLLSALLISIKDVHSWKLLLSSDMKLLSRNPLTMQNSKLDLKWYLTGLVFILLAYFVIRFWP